MGEGVELLFGQEVVVEYSWGESGVGKARLYTEERTELVQKMGEAPLVDGSLGFTALSGWSTTEAGPRWCRWGTA